MNTCPICLEGEPLLFHMSCGHPIHLECCKGMINFLCPFCRAKVKNLPKDVSKQIRLNKKKNDDDYDNEMRVIAQRTQDAEVTEMYFVALGFPRDTDLMINAISRAMIGKEQDHRSIVDDMIHEVLTAYSVRPEEPRSWQTNYRDHLSMLWGL